MLCLNDALNLMEKVLTHHFPFYTISLLNLLSKSKVLYVQCDNCPSTNKNNYALWFFHYLIHSKKIFDEVRINYMIPGHTKFSVDGRFGNSK